MTAAEITAETLKLATSLANIDHRIAKLEAAARTAKHRVSLTGPLTQAVEERRKIRQRLRELRQEPEAMP